MNLLTQISILENIEDGLKEACAPLRTFLFNKMLSASLTLFATASKSPPVHGGRWIPPPPGNRTYTHFLAKKMKYPKTYI